MKQRLFARLATVAAVAIAATCLPAVAADTLRIGFMSTLSGPGGALGVDIRDGFNLAVKHAGGNLGRIRAYNAASQNKDFRRHYSGDAA